MTPKPTPKPVQPPHIPQPGPAVGSTQAAPPPTIAELVAAGFVPKGTYTVDTTLIVNKALTFAAGVILNGTPNAKPVLLANTTQPIEGAGCVINAAPEYAIQSRAKANIANFVIADGCGGGYLAETGAAGTVLTTVSCGVAEVEYNFYCQEDTTLNNCSGKGGKLQATVRGDTPDNGKTTPTVTINGGTYSKVATNVQTVEMRQANFAIGMDPAFPPVIINDYIGMVSGQGTDGNPPFKPGEMGTGTLGNVIFTAGGPDGSLLVRFGSVVTYSKSRTKFIDGNQVKAGGGVIHEAD
jgi:hypothetical protein